MKIFKRNLGKYTFIPIARSWLDVLTHYFMGRTNLLLAEVDNSIDKEIKRSPKPRKSMLQTHPWILSS
jgi:hypothetical protein